MNTVVIISANAEWRVAKELYPNLEIQNSPYGEFANLTFDHRPFDTFPWRLGENFCGSFRAICDRSFQDLTS